LARNRSPSSTLPVSGSPAVAGTVLSGQKVCSVLPAVAQIGSRAPARRAATATTATAIHRPSLRLL
jgi:hypothetical protein